MCINFFILSLFVFRTIYETTVKKVDMNNLSNKATYVHE